MLPYAVKIGRIPERIYTLFLKMQETVRAFPEIPEDDLTCHAICRALVKLYPEFQFQDGHFDQNCQHTWIVHPDAPHVVMDMYPVGGGGALIVDAGARHVCWSGLYDTTHPPYFDGDVVQAQTQYLLKSA